MDNLQNFYAFFPFAVDRAVSGVEPIEINYGLWPIVPPQNVITKYFITDSK